MDGTLATLETAGDGGGGATPVVPAPASEGWRCTSAGAVAGDPTAAADQWPRPRLAGPPDGRAEAVEYSTEGKISSGAKTKTIFGWWGGWASVG